jgi:hypothetical protein
MNKIRKLFSPSTLAATVATGMLAMSAVNAYADILISACNIRYSPNCPPTGCVTLCHDPSDNNIVWCCDGWGTCGSYVQNCAQYGCGWCISE